MNSLLNSPKTCCIIRNTATVSALATVGESMVTQRRATQNNPDQVDAQAKIEAALEMLTFLEGKIDQLRQDLNGLKEQLKRVIYPSA